MPQKILFGMVRQSLGNLSPRSQKNLQKALTIALAAPILVAGIAKGFSALEFAGNLKYSFGLPEWASALTASVVPLLETVVAIGLLFGDTFFLALVGCQLLTGAFFIFHLWNILFVGSAKCSCYGNLLHLDARSTFILASILLLLSIILAFLDRLSIQNGVSASRFPQSSIFRGKKLAILALALFLAAATFGYMKNRAGLADGLIYNVRIESAREKLEKILQRYVPSQKPDGKPILILFFSNPNCTYCFSELMYWNEVEFADQVSGMAVFPTELKIDTTSMRKLYKLKLGFATADESTRHQIFGPFSPLVTRILVSANGEIRDVTFGSIKENQDDLQAFVERLMSEIKH